MQGQQVGCNNQDKKGEANYIELTSSCTIQGHTRMVVVSSLLAPPVC